MKEIDPGVTRTANHHMATPVPDRLFNRVWDILDPVRSGATRPAQSELHRVLCLGISVAFGRRAENRLRFPPAAR